MSAVIAPELAVALAAEADADDWDRYVSSHPQASGYHLWGWRRVFREALGHESMYLVAREPHRIAGVLPLVFIKSPIFGRTLTSMAFLNYGGVVADSDAAADALLDEAQALARRLRCKHVELRHKAQRFATLPCRQHKVTMLLTLEAGMWERLDRKTRNQIRKAQKSDLTVETGGSELLNAFYTVFARNMRDLGTPVYSPRLFGEVLATFPDQARLHVVRLGAQPVAAGLTYRSRDVVEVPWASSIRDFNSLCPNHLLYWSVIEDAVARGTRILDFGRSTPNQGTYKFKEQWGAEPLPLHWEYVLPEGHQLPDLAPTNPKFQLMVEAWKKLPLKLATTLGPHVVRGIP